MKRASLSIIVLLALVLPTTVFSQSVPYTTLPGQVYHPQQYVQPTPQYQPAVPWGDQRRLPGAFGSIIPRSNTQRLRPSHRSYRAPSYTPPARQYNPSDPYGVKPYTQGFRLPEWKKRELERIDRAQEKTILLNCYQYNKGCALQLKGLGGDED